MRRYPTLLLVCIGVTAGCFAEPVFEPQEIRIAAGKDVQGVAFISATDDATLKNEKEGVKLIEIKDLGPAGGVGAAGNLVVKFSTPPDKVSGTAQRIRWKSTITVANMPPTASSTRLAQLIFSDKSIQSINYNLTTRPKNFSWSVTSGAKTIVFPPNAGFGVSVVTTGDGGTNLRIDNNSLHETSTGFHIDTDWLKIEPDPVPPASAATSALAEGTRKTFVISFADTIPNGNYSGSINLALDESPDTKAIEITLSRSTCGSRWLGVGVMFLGVLLSFLGGTLARNISAAAEALMPAARLQALVGTRRQKITQCGVAKSVPQTLLALKEVDDGLSPDQLRAAHLVPGWFSSPFGVPQVATGAYGTYLQDKSNRLTVLGFLIEHGICVAAARDYNPQEPAQVTAREKALKDLDALSLDPGKTVTQLSTEIPAILNAYQMALVPPAAGAAPALGSPPAISDRPSIEDLSFRVNLASAGAWAVAFLATIVTGYAVLIGSNHGFGVEMDFVKCFLWGFGVQIAGQQLSLLTPSSVTSTLGFIKAPTT